MKKLSFFGWISLIGMSFFFIALIINLMFNFGSTRIELIVLTVGMMLFCQQELNAQYLIREFKEIVKDE